MRRPRFSSIMLRLRIALLKALLRASGMDIFTTRRLCREVEQVSATKGRREQERAEIHLLAQGLGLRDRDSREDYERALKWLFGGRRSSTALTDEEHTQFLEILRAWTRARAVARDKAQRVA